MNLIILLVVLGLIAWGVSLLPIPAPFPQIIWVVLVIIALLAVLRWLPGVHLGF